MTTILVTAPTDGTFACVLAEGGVVEFQTTTATAGGVTAVTASPPLASSGGATPNVSLTGIVGVPNGGTGVATLTAHGVLVGEGAGNIVATGVGAAGQVLTSNGPGVDPSFQAAPATGTPLPVAFSVPHVTTSSTKNIPAGVNILRVSVFVTTAFSAGGTIEVGVAGTPALLFGTGVADPTQPAGTVFNVDPQQVTGWINWPGGQILVTVGGAPAAGAVTVQVTYATPVP